MTHENPIVEVALESFDGDRWSWSFENLFQMCRLWSEYRDDAPPIDWRDSMPGHVSRSESEETGEDYAYWEAVDALETIPVTDRQSAVVQAFHYFESVYDSAKEAGEDY